ncbi:DUF1080 domain-containing protein [Seonamhaeicola sp.]|uniref:3-keto-disaccharide hydrolase n=1 Tax=Seonamhaeicola sp. TaxID=1912245 RepID=UPI00261DD423|nr:DUF1080 domain-containing protein [Seonamhaeicola sp.]
MNSNKYVLRILLVFSFITASVWAQKTDFYKSQGYTSLFNGKDLSNWVIPEENNNSWSVFQGTIDCALTYSDKQKAKRHLTTKKKYKDFALHIEWRFKGYGGSFYKMPIILPNGDYVLDEHGEKVVRMKPNADSGILLKGVGQVNLWCWDVGSGELWHVRNNKKLPSEVRAGAVPTSNQDNPVGSWNAMDVYVKGNRITVVNNGIIVIDNALYPGLDVEGEIALQHHGKRSKDGKLGPTASLVQFKNIWIKEL